MFAEVNSGGRVNMLKIGYSESKSKCNIKATSVADSRADR